MRDRFHNPQITVEAESEFEPVSTDPPLPSRAPNVKWTITCFSSKTGRKGVSPGVRFSLRWLHVGEVFPWYTCMPTLGASPHSACGVRRAQAPVVSTTTGPQAGCAATFLRFSATCEISAVGSLFAHPSVMEREFEVGILPQHRAGASDTLASLPQTREKQVIIHVTFGALSFAAFEFSKCICANTISRDRRNPLTS